MRDETCAVCCGGLCQHPECWRSSIQKVREAVWRRNGGIPHDESHEAPKNNALYMQKERTNSGHGDLPTLKVVDMFSDLNASIKKTSKKHIEPFHQRSFSLPCLPSAVISHDSVLSPPRSPRQSPALTSPLMEYRHGMKWKRELNKPTGIKSAANSVKMSTIGVHEVYEEDEFDQEWQDVYVTSAYLVWCPSTKKGRKAKRNSSKSNKNVLPKDVTEELVPASMETKKQCRPKSTKTPTGGQPFSPHKPVSNTALYQYGMEDLSNLPKPVLSGILKRINWRSNEGSPSEEQKETKISSDEETDLTLTQQEVSTVLLEVDINSQLTTPAQDKQLLEEQSGFDKEKSSTTNEPILLQTTDLSEIKHGRTFLSMHPIGLPIDDLPEPKHHHCTNSIPRRTSLGVALEPVNLVPITPSPAITPKQLSHHEVSVEKSKPDDPSLVVNVPSGRPESAPIYAPLDMSDKFADRYFVNSAFRYTPSPVRAPASTPISPDKYLEFARYSRTSRRRSSSQDEQILNSRRRLNTLGSIDDFEDGGDKCAQTDKEMLFENKGEFLEGGGVFITEGSADIMNGVACPIPKCRSPSPGSRTCIPKDIIEQFHGDIYGRRYSARAECDGIQIRNASKHIGAGIVAPGWRTPRSRTPIQLSETPARYPPRPLRQPPIESIPKSLQIVSLPSKKKVLTRPRSTPPRPNSPKDNDLVPFVLSESSLVNLSADSTVSMEVKGPSSIATDSGAVPPPPSPEAMLGLKNELQPTLGTLCEEDERSSRTTSVVDIVEKDVPLSRLSPLGGGSEISEESVDLPTENTNEDQSNENSKITKLHLQNEKCIRSTGEKPGVNLDPKADIKVDVHRPSLVESSSELQQNEKPCEAHTPEGSSELQLEGLHKSNLTLGDCEPYPIVKPTEQQLLEKTSESCAPEQSYQHPSEGLCELHQTSGSYQQFPSEISYEPHPSEELLQTSEQHAQEELSEPDRAVDASEPSPGLAKTLSSPDLNPSQESYQPGDQIGALALKRNSPENMHQPPGSPVVTSNHDFTEGLDMGLDLAAELKAAMEGLDSFSVLSEDDD